MSTSKILNGDRYQSARQRRLDALEFFARQSRLVGAPGRIAFAIHQALKKVYRDPTLSGPDKEREFRRIIQTAGRIGAGAGPVNVAAVPSVPADDQSGAVAEVAGTDDSPA